MAGNSRKQGRSVFPPASRAEAYARQQAERARVEAVRALQDAEDAREQTESQNEVEPEARDCANC